MNIALAVMIGLGLSAACGLRVFVPLLVLSIAAHAGSVALAPSLAWIGSQEAVIAFACATVLEVVAYKVPWLDHFLDVAASPAAVVAGTIVSASQIGAIGGVSPLIQWSCALIAGGGIAGLMQTATVGTRAISTMATAGTANPIISAGQSVLSVAMSLLSIVLPILAAIAVVIFVAIMGLVVWRWRAKRRRVVALRMVQAAPVGAYRVAQ